MTRVQLLTTATTLAAAAVENGTAPDRFNDLVLQACLDEWTGTWTPGVSPDPAGRDAALAKAEAVNKAGFRSQFATLIQADAENADAVADELLRRIELDAARTAAGVT